MWDKVRCYWEQVGEHIKNLGNMLENTYENPKKSNIPPSHPPPRLDACTSIKMLIHPIHTLGQV